MLNWILYYWFLFIDWSSTFNLAPLALGSNQIWIYVSAELLTSEEGKLNISSI